MVLIERRNSTLVYVQIIVGHTGSYPMSFLWSVPYSGLRTQYTVDKLCLDCVALRMEINVQVLYSEITFLIYLEAYWCIFLSLSFLRASTFHRAQFEVLVSRFVSLFLERYGRVAWCTYVQLQQIRNGILIIDDERSKYFLSRPPSLGSRCW